jgi:NADH-quinone oxidoreductase subunit J
MPTGSLLLLVLTLGSAVAAMSLRNLVHCALCAAITFLCLAAYFLGLGAEFVGFAQILVYVGAVAILIVIAILVTRDIAARGEALVFKPWILGVGVAVLVAGTLVSAVIASALVRTPLPPAPAATVQAIGEKLMTHYVVPLETIGLLLTAALVGAVLLARPQKEGGNRP